MSRKVLIIKIFLIVLKMFREKDCVWENLAEEIVSIKEELSDFFNKIDNYEVRLTRELDDKLWSLDDYSKNDDKRSIRLVQPLHESTPHLSTGIWMYSSQNNDLRKYLLRLVVGENFSKEELEEKIEKDLLEKYNIKIDLVDNGKIRYAEVRAPKYYKHDEEEVINTIDRIINLAGELDSGIEYV